jgi:hypothetical protein
LEKALNFSLESNGTKIANESFIRLEISGFMDLKLDDFSYKKSEQVKFFFSIL